MLEKECQIIDFKIAAKTQLSTALDERELEEVINTYQIVEQLDKEIEEHDHTIDLIHAAIASQMQNHPENEEEIHDIFEPRLQHFVKMIETKVRFFAL